MASSIIGGLINRGHAASLISASDLDTEKLGALAAKTGLSAADNETIARTADVIVLAVKPQVMSAVCTALYPIINRTNSTTASVTLAYSLPVMVYWASVPMSYNKTFTIEDIVINPMLLRKEQHIYMGVLKHLEEKTYTITVENMLPSQSYHLYIVLVGIDHNRTTSELYTFEIP